VEAAELAQFDALAHQPGATQTPLFSEQVRLSRDELDRIERLAEADHRRAQTMLNYMQTRAALMGTGYWGY